MVILFSIGTIVASFIYVIANLWHVDHKILTERSRCDLCNRKLPFYTLIPILSFLFLKGKCKFCHENIPIENLLIELLLGIIYILPIFNFIENELIVQYYLLLSILVPLTFVDIKKFIVPNHMLIILIVSGGYLISFNLKVLLLKFLFITLIILIYSIISRFIGFGDIKLFSVLLLLLPVKIFIMIVLSTFILGGVTIIIFELFFKDKCEKYPLVPFITAATIIVFITSKELSYLYGGLI